MDNYKELKRETFVPIHLMKGDSIHLTIEIDTFTRFFFKKKLLHKSEYTVGPVDRPMVFDTSVIFEAEIDGKKIYGGFVEERQ